MPARKKATVSLPQNYAQRLATIVVPDTPRQSSKRKQDQQVARVVSALYQGAIKTKRAVLADKQLGRITSARLADRQVAKLSAGYGRPSFYDAGDNYGDHAPDPKVSRFVRRTIEQKGLATAALSANAGSLHKYIHTVEDSFHGALLAHLYSPNTQFPLPALYRPGLTSAEPFSSTNAGVFPLNTPTGDAASSIGTAPQRVPFAEWLETRGTTFHPTANDCDALTSRYVAYQGKALNTFKFTTDVNGDADIWVFHDPTDIGVPYQIIQVPPVVSGQYLDLPVAQQGVWDNDPYMLTHSYYPVGGDHPDLQADAANLYFTGGAALEVNHINKSAFLAVSYQTRTGTNTINRFVNDLEHLWQFTDVAQCLNLTDQPEEADGAISLYTGTQWHMGATALPGLADPDTVRFGLSGSFRRCWSMGAPWVRLVVRTTSGGIPGAGSVQFNVAFHNWIGVAPCLPAFAGACPHETVPFPMPTWISAVHVRGTVWRGKTRNKDYAALTTSTAFRVPRAVSATTPLLRSVAAAPVETVAKAKDFVSNLPVPTSSWFGDAGSMAKEMMNLAAGLIPFAALLA